MSLIPRSEWGAKAPRKTRPLPKSVRGVCVHWVGVPIEGDPRDMALSIQRYHMETKKWWDLAYNVLIGDGVALEGRGWTNRSGANGSGKTNRSHAAMCVLIGPGQAVTDGHVDAVRTQIAAFRRCYPKAMEIVGHRDLKPTTSCPGPELIDLIRTGVFEPANSPIGQLPGPHPSSGYPIPVRTIRQGFRGDDVAWLQHHLNNNGQRLVVDGIAGPKTIRGVRKFQITHGLLVDGLAGNQTVSLLMGLAL